MTELIARADVNTVQTVTVAPCPSPSSVKWARSADIKVCSTRSERDVVVSDGSTQRFSSPVLVCFVRLCGCPAA